jgi:transposase
MHRVRERLIKQKVALGNELRGFLLEFGVVIGQGDRPMRALPETLERNQETIPPLSLGIIKEQLEEYWHLRSQIVEYDKRLNRLAQQHPESNRLMTIRGVGPIVSTAIIAAVSSPEEFLNGRQFAAWLGLVPKQHSTGGKPRLGPISKRGDSYIRKQLIHGARSVLCRAHLRTDALSCWVTKLVERRGWNCAAVALANKNARIIWALLSSKEVYKVAAKAA